MSISNYGELKTAVDNWLHRADLTSRVPEFIKLAEDRIAQNLKIRAMETSTDITINSQEEALPTRFKGVRRFYLDTNPARELGFMNPTAFWARWGPSLTGQPEMFTIEGENFVFGPSPDGSYTGKLLYWQRFATLSADGDDNWVLTNAGGLLLYGSLIEAAPFLKNDTRILTWIAMWDQLVEDVENADRKDRFSYPLVSRPAVMIV